MVKYCDSKVLEQNWFDWLVASATPFLDEFRKHGLLWTRIKGQASGGIGADPCCPDRRHCIALATPIFFRSKGSLVQSTGIYFAGGKSRTIELATIMDELSLISDSWLHGLNDPLVVPQQVVPKLRRLGYRVEQATDLAWYAMLGDVINMCKGIAARFMPPSDEEHLELAHEAFEQVTNKLYMRKLVFTPGRAPVFNLLTTTIFRCMYSIQNKRKYQRLNMRKLLDDMQNGVLPDNIRSFKAEVKPTIRSR